MHTTSLRTLLTNISDRYKYCRMCFAFRPPLTSVPWEVVITYMSNKQEGKRRGSVTSSTETHRCYLIQYMDPFLTTKQCNFTIFIYCAYNDVFMVNAPTEMCTKCVSIDLRFIGICCLTIE